MTRKPTGELRRGWTTGACATAACKAALFGLWGDAPARVSITLPKGEVPQFEVVEFKRGDGWAEAGIIKDAGDDPDVTHGVTVIVRVARSDGGVVFRAGEGVGTVTKAGLPIGVSEAAINPVPRSMMDEVVAEVASEFGESPDIEITVSIPNGEEIAQKTWNPRLGIKGGLSILGTTGIVRPFSCAAWIASIHRGIDVARADGVTHVAGCTGNMSEKAVQALFGLPDHAMLDMGDFVGGMVKYIRRHPVERLTIGGGIGKLTKLAQGAVDLHSGRSQVDFAQLSELVGDPRVACANTALEAYEIAGKPLAEHVARLAAIKAMDMFDGGTAPAQLDVVIVDRAGQIIAQTETRKS
ncbi:cobalt-precorrin-5B (C(1))-methyltransferase [Octadecabacter sp. 1_MG-2023]|uniref:cobalt-precorrin-5B (C(1))-methyltransferase n=1 Tax=unclassified Octadecabacter TaxID=196158 RepID=UPI001C0A31DD|nr:MULTISPECIES: cobalt-precorrin-5B (C(1))-methyltransferase [unclassified Octadecabacter]MBU2993402.1 cobalt-precorrin-5B (C(1))-methyltransferase [Octadecabacter sp. B2R22]MDO6733142.1 cobalt-precorrin-5B (C(1))-methyltransferase [Octadecabacter sp. 1_MG-2023]